MDKRAQISSILGRMLKDTGKAFFTAQVKRVEGNVCTVAFDDLQVSDVRLTATTTGGKDTVLITPVVDSFVIVGSHSGDLHNLSVMSVDAAEKIEIVCGETSVFLDKGNIKINCGKTTLVLNEDKLLFKDIDMWEWMKKVYDDFAKLQSLLSLSLVAGNGAQLAISFLPTTPQPIDAPQNDKK